MATHKDDVLQQPHALTSAGCDWLTATARRVAANEPFHELGMMLLEEEAESGNDIRQWKWMGYHGRATNSLRVGVRRDSWLLSLSSEVARSHWREVYALADNVSRLDVQATVELDQAHPSIVRELHGEATAQRRRTGRPTNYTLLSSTISGDTLYVGQRSSDRYLRCYDKGVESRCAPAGKLLRYECEFKRGPARAVASSMYQSPEDTAYATGVISEHFLRRGLRVPSSCEEGRWDASSLTPADVDRKLLWLGRAIAPTVRFLLDRGRSQDVLRALGLAATLNEVETLDRR